jgi:hypothetical protein
MSYEEEDTYLDTPICTFAAPGLGELRVAMPELRVAMPEPKPPPCRLRPSRHHQPPQLVLRPRPRHHWLQKCPC